MNILQLIHTQQLRGAEMFAAQLSNHLADRNHRVFILAVYNGNGQLPTDIAVESLQAVSSFDLKAMKRLSNFIAENNIDLVQANAGDTLKFVAFTKLIFRLRCKIVFRNASTMSRYLKTYKQKLLYKLLLSRFDHIISVSETSRRDLLETFPQFRHKTTVIPVGVEENSIHLTERERVLLHVGGFSFEKNHKGLLSIFSQLLNKHPDYKLWLVGDGPLKEEIKLLVHEMNLSDKVVFWGARKDVAHFMHRASVFVLPSIIEGLPAVIVEAMQAELPVVSYDVGGIHELIRDRETGRLIPVNDEVAFADAVDDVIRDSQKTDEIVKQATLLVNKEYKNEVIAARFENIYARLLNSELCNKEVLQPVL